VLTTSCASGPNVHAIYKQEIDFSQFDSFKFVERLSPNGEAYLSIETQYIIEAIREQLSVRGLVESEAPQLLVNFNISQKEKLITTALPVIPSGYYAYRDRSDYGTSFGLGSQNVTTQYTEGTLNIDVIDAALKQVLWEGVAVGRLKQIPSNKLKSYVYDIIESVFEEYPIVKPNADLTDNNG
jgi:hypothetical protein